MKLPAIQMERTPISRLYVAILLLLASSQVVRASEDASMPAPEKAIVIDLHRPWLDAARYDKDVPSATIYGVDAAAEHPKFTVIDPDVRGMWMYRFVQPIDLAAYPIVTMKYRCQGISKSQEYALRLVRGKGSGPTRVLVGTGADLVADGKEHEFTQDLRDLKLESTEIVSFGIGVKSDKEPAWMELIDLRFNAAADAKNEAPKEDMPVQIRVSDPNDQPIANAKVIVDAERVNFAKSAQTDKDGFATVTPLLSASGKHMVRVEREGYMSVEAPELISQSGQAVDIQTYPAVRYGGIAKDADGKIAANAQVVVKLNGQVNRIVKTRFGVNVVTNEKGEWSTQPLPSDPTLVTIQLTHAGKDGPVVAGIDSTEAQLKTTAVAGDAAIKGSAPFLAAAGGATETAAPATQPEVGIVTIKTNAGGTVTSAVIVPQGGTVVVRAPSATLSITEQPANAAPAAAKALPAPEQSVTIDLHRPWLDGANWDENTPPSVYGVDATLPEPRFTILDPHASSLWVYRFALPIDLKMYPILTVKYRATNTSKDAPYVLRLVHGEGEARERFNVWKGSDLVADGQPHELKQDLRELNANTKLTTFGIGFKTDDKPATLDLLDVTLSAAPDGHNDKPKEEPPMKVRVVDPSGKPLAGANVIIDAERANFARSAKTGDNGEASVTSITNEIGRHMVRAERDGYLTTELPNAISESGQGFEIKMIPAVVYGGTATGSDGKLAANAQVAIKLKPELLAELPMRFQTNIVTNEKGEWSSVPLPVDISQVMMTLTQRDASGNATTSDLEPAKFQKTSAPIVAAAPASEVKKESPATKPAVANREVAKNKPAPVNAITAVIQKVDDTTTAVGFTGIANGQLQVIFHPKPGTDEPGMIPLMDVTDVIFKKGGGYNSPTTSPSTAPTKKLMNCRVQMADDDRLVGDIVAWSDKRITLKPLLAKESTFEFPVTRLREIWCGTSDQLKKAQALNEKAGVDDILFAVKENEIVAVHGIVIDMRDDGLHFRFGEEDRKIALNKVVGLMLAKPDEAPDQDTFYQAVQFVTDEQLSGTVSGFDGKHFTLAPRGGGKELSLPIEQVAKISTRNGRLVYLSDLTPAKVEQVPYFDRMLSYQRDKSLNGKPITMLDGTYAKGICMHSRCVLTYNIDGKFNELRAKVGFALPEGKIGQAIVRVLGDGKTLYENIDARGDAVPVEVKLKLDGVRELTLEVDYGKNDDTGDRVVFANARLLRAAPQQSN